MIRRHALVCAALVALAAPRTSPALPAHASTSSRLTLPTLATLRLPGTPRFAAVARDVIALRFAIDPSIAASAGLFDDGCHVPSFAPDTVAARVARLDRDLEALRAMPWRTWSVDRQVDWRWIVASAEDARLQLVDEKLYLHRPAAWLEPLANTLIALVTYAPERAALRARIARGIPDMVAEMRRVALEPTSRDVTTARGVAAGILASLRQDAPGAGREAAIAALTGYIEELSARTDLHEFGVIGREHYETRLRRALLLPWTAGQLLATAQAELAVTDSALATLKERIHPERDVPAAPAATPEQQALAATLDQATLLSMYDEVARADRAFLDSSDLVTVPSAVGPIHARPTPLAMIPLTGDGGSMNPPPPVGRSNVGWWNVEHLDSTWTLEQKAARIAATQGFRRSWLGPYAAHEGVPGHHLQLSIARLNPNPIRWILQDNDLVEGWAMYAEDLLWRSGGLDGSPVAAYRTLASYRGRIRRVVYDVNIECGDWSLQQAADYKRQTPPGKAQVDEDILRSINWPAQLVAYFAGRTQLLELKRAYREKLGDAFTERAFNDAVLAEGSIPVALIRAKLLGEPVPEPESARRRRATDLRPAGWRHRFVTVSGARSSRGSRARCSACGRPLRPRSGTGGRRA